MSDNHPCPTHLKNQIQDPLCRHHKGCDKPKNFIYLDLVGVLVRVSTRETLCCLHNTEDILSCQCIGQP